MNSKEKLAQALTEAGATAEMIELARTGYYSDYESPLPTPCIQLVVDLTAAGLMELRERAKNGEFDATKEESDEWWEREGRRIARDIHRKAQ